MTKLIDITPHSCTVTSAILQPSPDGTTEQALREGTAIYFLLSFVWLISSYSAAIADKHLRSPMVNRNSMRASSSVHLKGVRTVATSAKTSAWKTDRCTMPHAQSVGQRAKFPSSLAARKRVDDLSSAKRVSTRSAWRHKCSV